MTLIQSNAPAQYRNPGWYIVHKNAAGDPCFYFTQDEPTRDAYIRSLGNTRFNVREVNPLT